MGVVAIILILIVVLLIFIIETAIMISFTPAMALKPRSDFEGFLSGYPRILRKEFDNELDFLNEVPERVGIIWDWIFDD
ncbi:Uncharacterised protein [Candidatus Venteria ishoeyi]|uniref:Uncharacterized protein n=2 Tax=Candidatus Venteria ishoeyi TaxID=1899563 RepID=A0A1H6F352_9GAMM|nr:Uncharacterised protein [Candidatus Venteria ishoeyi]